MYSYPRNRARAFSFSTRHFRQACPGGNGERESIGIGQRKHDDVTANWHEFQQAGQLYIFVYSVQVAQQMEQVANR